nr:ribonuclease H-like domain-containing protein [Tanacetum cinerariifolium]
MSANDKFGLGYGYFRYGSIEYESDIDDDLVSNVQEDKEKPSFAFLDSVKHVKNSREIGKLLLRPQQVVIRETKEILRTKSSNTTVDQRLEKNDPHRALKDKGIVDSGCSRNMIGNKAHLVNYQEFKGDSIAFGGSNGRITGKGNIKAGSFNHKNIDPSGDLACLFAKASIDESNKWHRRLGHVNFKNLNKLVKGKLVRVENQANKSASSKEANNSAGTEANDDQGANSKEIDLHEKHFVLPIWPAYSTTIKSSGDKIEKTTDDNTCEKPIGQVEQIFWEELEKLKRQEKEANVAARKETTHENQDANTNLLNAVSKPISTVGPSRALNDGESLYPDDPLMPHLEDIYASPSEGIFTDSSYDD